MTQTGKVAFYFLCGLVLLTVLAVLAVNLNWFGAPASESAQAFAKWGMVGVIGEIIGLFVVVVKAIVKPRAFSLVIGPPEKAFDISQIVWEAGKCFVRCGDRKIKVTPTQNPLGPGFEVRLPSEIFDWIGDTETVELELVDRKGNRWEVLPFYIFQRPAALSYFDTREQIVASYLGAAA